MILDVDHLRIIMAPVRVIDTGIIKELFHCDTNVPTPEGRAHGTSPFRFVDFPSVHLSCGFCLMTLEAYLIMIP